MNKDKNYGLITLFVVIALLVGGILTYAAFPREVTKEVIKNVPGSTVYINSTEIKTIPLDAKATYLDAAIKDFMSDLEDQDLLECDGVYFDEDQIKISKVDKDWGVLFGKDQNEVSFQVKLKYLDKDVEDKCYLTGNVTVTYEEGEDPEIERSEFVI